VAIGPHCDEPYECPFKARCWPTLPAHHLSTLYRGGRRAEALAAQGYRTLLDLPADLALPEVAARQVRAVREGRLIVEPGLAAALHVIQPPVAYLDFETIMPAVPCWTGCHPYQQVPVQLSCHLVDARGAPRHHAFLAEGPGDPRPAVAEAVLRACAGAETVVAYGASFERRCLEHLAAAVPERAAELRAVAARLVDLLPIVRGHVYHPDFGGSFSLKQVLPALVPELGYADLAIAEGGTAQAALERLLLQEATIPAAERAALRLQLLDYCARDTLALVRLVERLAGLAGSGPRR
jgi:predicted RecB family nuclease